MIVPIIKRGLSLFSVDLSTLDIEEIEVGFCTEHCFIAVGSTRVYSTSFVHPKYPRAKDTLSTIPFAFFLDKETMVKYLEQHSRRLEKQQEKCKKHLKKLMVEG